MDPAGEGAIDWGQAPRPGGDPSIVGASARAPAPGEQIAESERRSPPKLLHLSAVLGRDAAAFARRYRYAGLGLLQLILSRNRVD
jgi:hypothetical protein